MKQGDWWQGAVIYQIYPRSLKDTNNDGVGDIPGIIEKIDYIASLGVDAIWVSPFFKSPMKDFGYDISDYRDIDPLFGTLDDFDRLIESAHAAGIKVIIDQVLSHTSDQHEWFKTSRLDKTNDKSDWYVWADAHDDGGPPNNWLSIFGGGAWQWEPRRGQYYLHNFLDSQPDLNYHNPAVRAQMLDEVEFWLKRGVDGFRLDAINFCYHDAQLRDNPAKPLQERKGRGFSEDNPYAFQYHYYNNTQPENLDFLEDLRQLLDQYPNTVALGEISSEDSLATMAEYTEGDKRLHTAYSFELLVDEFSADYIRNTVSTLEARMNGGWPCWAVGNHDVTRVMSRWGKQHANNTQLAKMINSVLVSLKGSVCSYQGEELGLTEASINFDELQDPYGIAFWPNFKGRDGCRTPMPWDNQEHSGFSEKNPWLPIASEHLDKNVEQQNGESNSVLNHYRQLLKWRKRQSAICQGDIEFVEGSDNVLLFIRRHEQQAVWVCFNFNDHAVEVKLPENLDSLIDIQLNPIQISESKITLPAFDGLFGEQSCA